MTPLLRDGHTDIVVTAGNRDYRRLKTSDGVDYFNAGAGGEVDSGSFSESQSDQVIGVDHTNTALILKFEDASCQFQAIDLLESVVDEGTILKGDEGSETSTVGGAGVSINR